MPKSLLELSRSTLMRKVIGLNPPNPPLYPIVYPPITLLNLSITQDPISIPQAFTYVIIKGIPHNTFVDPFILRCLDSQEANIVLHMVHDGISRGLFSGLILATNSERLLRSYGHSWIQRLLASSMTNRFLLSSYQQHS